MTLPIWIQRQDLRSPLQINRNRPCFWHNSKENTFIAIGMASEDTFEVVKRLVLDRRSVRKYLDKEIPMEELKEVIALAQERLGLAW